ncbi:MAG: NAD-dependent epimerase/dehydratase family protein [Stackebrandtia sp.]
MSSRLSRVTVLGGTRFIGRAVVAELLRTGHQVQLVHRGDRGCHLFPEAAHIHSRRAELADHARSVRAFKPDVVVDVNGMTASDVSEAAPVFAGAERFVVISSCDVYEAYLGYRTGVHVQDGDVDERSALRTRRRIFTAAVPGRPDYDKLDVEAAWSDYPAVILRPTAVYGPHDYLRREGFILDRVLAGRRKIPFGKGDLRYTRVSSADLAACVRMAATSDRELRGEVFNVAEATTLSTRAWAETIGDAIDADIELVPVPDDLLPSDLRLSASYRQHLTISADKARRVLGWSATHVADRIKESVQWHAGQPATRASFADDDTAMREGRRGART